MLAKIVKWNLENKLLTIVAWLGAARERIRTFENQVKRRQ